MMLTVEAKNVGDEVRIIRVAKKWTQKALGTIAKVDQGTISRIERNLSVDEKEPSESIEGS